MASMLLALSIRQCAKPPAVNLDSPPVVNLLLLSRDVFKNESSTCTQAQAHLQQQTLKMGEKKKKEPSWGKAFSF